MSGIFRLLLRNKLSILFLFTIFIALKLLFNGRIEILSKNLKNQNEIRSNTFSIDFSQDTFVKDSKPFQFISGSLHFYRVPFELWKDRLIKFFAAGLNTVETYIFWNQHEPYPGIYDFSGQNDLFYFLKLCQQTGLNVIIRPGPYSCAERDFGGLPWWLLANGTKFVLPRTSERNFMNAVRRWLNVILPKLKSHLYKNGGPILAVQIENEYGSYFACDENYTLSLKNIFKEHLGEETVYFTTDGHRQKYLKCGVIHGVYPTIDFRPGHNVARSFKEQRKYVPTGPLVNSEFYSGWFDYWGSPHSKTDITSLLKTFAEMQKFKANVNFYMFHGGTNFGFSNGAIQPFNAQTTSYDYDAPISEAGDITDKYLAIRNAISRYFRLPPISVPHNSSKISYGKVKMEYHIPLVDIILNMTSRCVDTIEPISFETLGQGYGFVLYSTDISSFVLNNSVLYIPGIRDRGFIQVGNVSVGLVYRHKVTNITINLPKSTIQILYIVVENMGRLNYGDNLLDAKGILSDVTLNDKILKNWRICNTDNFIPNYRKNLNDPRFLSFISKYRNSEFLLRSKMLKDRIDFKTPALFFGEFETARGDFDTFLKIENFQKGVAFIQSSETLTNLGRYWPHLGPQLTLFIPSVFMKKEAKNYIALIEFENSTICEVPENCYVELIDYPILDKIGSKIQF